MQFTKSTLVLQEKDTSSENVTRSRFPTQKFNACFEKKDNTLKIQATGNGL